MLFFPFGLGAEPCAVLYIEMIGGVRKSFYCSVAFDIGFQDNIKAYFLAFFNEIRDNERS